MICYEFKGGTGTASRRLGAKDGGYTVGVLVQANCGRRKQLTIAGIPSGRELGEPGIWSQDTGSIIIVVATDAPLLPHQLKRLARRASLGLARTGSVSGNGSGDLFLAFSTANLDAAEPEGVAKLDMLPNDRINPLFEATVQATEEAIINALVAAEPMTGQGGHHVPALPHEEVRRLLQQHGRLDNEVTAPPRREPPAFSTSAGAAGPGRLPRGGADVDRPGGPLRPPRRPGDGPVGGGRRDVPARARHAGEPFRAVVDIPKGMINAADMVFFVFLVGGAFTVVG